MKHLKPLQTAVILLFFAFIAGCKKDISTSNSSDLRPLQTLSKNATIQPMDISAELKDRLAGYRATLPAGYEKRLQENANRIITAHPEYRDLVLKALNIIPTACNDNTAINQWLDNELADWDSQVIFFAIITGMLDFPTYDALLFGNSSVNQYYGVRGEFSQRITKTMKDLKRFWNIESQDIITTGLHGNMLLDRARVIRIDMILYGDSQADAEFWADLIRSLLDEVPQYRRGDHPIFTFNAFAQPGFFFPPVGMVPDKIVMGDGMLTGLSAIGYDDVAPQAILAHEFGHHIQFQLGLTSNVRSPEATRRTELMADAFSAYYLSHARGATMQWKRVKLFLQVFFNIGDCSFTSSNHHGTPTQRMAAAEWGYQVADNAKKQGHIMTSQEFAVLFDAQLPFIVAQ